MISIIDTASIVIGDLVSFRLDAMKEIEIIGIISDVIDGGDFVVETAHGLILVNPPEITGAC